MPVVYSITSPSGKVYVGSTKQTLARRKAVHRAHYKMWKEDSSTGCCLSNILFDEAGPNACTWAILEECTEDVCRERERFYMDSIDCVNRNKPAGTVTIEEYKAMRKAIDKRYRETHREERITKMRAHYEAHKEEMRAYKRAWRAKKKAEAAATAPPASETTS